MNVLSGLDSLVAKDTPWPRGRVAVLTNQAAVDRTGRHLLAHMLQRGCPPVRVLSPEHGLWSTHQDMEAVALRHDPVFGLEVASLYGDDEASLAPDDGLLEDIDTLLVDLPDIGTRYYTYAATLARTLPVAVRTGTNVVVLDRPNPINGLDIEGGLPVPELRSYVGELPVPHRHGLTLCELAGLAMAEQRIDVECELRFARGWHRRQFFDETGLVWVPPSPNMPTLTTALVYPGLCLLEGTNVSEGRGTTTPFELFGAPWVKAEPLARHLHEELPEGGFALLPCAFRPEFGKWGGQVCTGLRLHVSDRLRFRPLRFGLALVKWLYQLHPDAFAWRTETYEFVDDVPAIDLLLGTADARPLLEQGERVEVVAARLEASAEAFQERREDLWVYTA